MRQVRYSLMAREAGWRIRSPGGMSHRAGPVRRIVCGGFGDDLVGEQVGACPLRPVMARRGDEEFTGRIEVVGIPSGPEHALPQDQVHVPRLADTETYPQIHLRTHRALSHGLLRRPLGRRDKSDRDRAAKPRDGIGVAHRFGCFVGQLGVFIDDDDQRWPGRGYRPGALAGGGEQFRACLEHRDRVAEQGNGLPGSGGEPANARLPPGLLT